MARGRFRFRKAISGSAALRGRLWTPAQLAPNLILWVDAQDTATVTVGGSPTRISQINDKSGNGRHLSRAVFANQPNWLTSGIGGKPAMQFEAARSASIRNAFGLQAQPFTYALVIRSPSAGGLVTTRFPMGPADNVGSTQRALIGYFDGPPFVWNQFAGSGSGPTGVSREIANDTDYALVFQYNGASSAASVNGTNTSPTNPNTEGFSGIELGAWNNGGLSANATIGEALVINGTLTSTNRELLEGYLAWRWGFPTSLPLAHPYRGFAPKL